MADTLREVAQLNTPLCILLVVWSLSLDTAIVVPEKTICLSIWWRRAPVQSIVAIMVMVPAYVISTGAGPIVIAATVRVILIADSRDTLRL